MTSSAVKHDIFQAIADPTRRKVLELLSEKELPIIFLGAFVTLLFTGPGKFSLDGAIGK